MVFSEGHQKLGGIKLGGKHKKTLATLERLQKELDAIQTAIDNKNLKEEDYRTLTDAKDKVIKQIQLLSGGATERVININFDSAFNETPSSTETNSSE